MKMTELPGIVPTDVTMSLYLILLPYMNTYLNAMPEFNSQQIALTVSTIHCLWLSAETKSENSTFNSMEFWQF